MVLSALSLHVTGATNVPAVTAFASVWLADVIVQVITPALATAAQLIDYWNDWASTPFST